MQTTERGELVVGGVEVGGYEVERCPDGTVRAAFWGVLALLAAEAEATTLLRVQEEQVVCLDAVGVEVDAAGFVVG